MRPGSGATALVVVDVQNDFCEGGSLAVQGGARVAAAVAGLLERGGYDHVVATADAHVDPGDHFSDEPDFVDSWPRHCVAGTPGAQFHPAVAGALEHHAEAVFRKGADRAAYSGFEGFTDTPDGGVMSLAEWLHDEGVTRVDVVGIATDHCVRATALDSARAGFTTRVLLDLTAGVSAETVASALTQLRDGGVEVVGELHG